MGTALYIVDCDAVGEPVSCHVDDAAIIAYTAGQAYHIHRLFYSEAVELVQQEK